MSYSSGEQVHNDQAIINIRKLAALDIVFHGPKLILAEFAFGVFFTGALGLVLTYAGFVTGHFRVPWVALLGCYLLALAINYLPLLLHAISIVRRRSAQEEVAFELAHKEHYARKYTVQSLLLLLPLVVPVLAISQERQKRRNK
ncbi:MAG TPA: hypothetical protein VF099_05540 [Ktedonobacterales bacterium]